MFEEYNEDEEFENYDGPEDDDDSDDEEDGFSVSESERAFIENSIADKEAMIEALEEDNDDGEYDDTISNIENEIDGLRHFLGDQWYTKKQKPDA